MRCLLGSSVKVVLAANRSMVGIEGIVINENKVNDSLVLQTANKEVRVEKCIISVDNRYIWTLDRNTKGLKKLKMKLTLL